jgi:gamma-glutamylcyclotransferase (GGCT)/AIG2-like uncharacterized protein YtfP
VTALTPAPHRLFAYGTLLPGQSRWHHLQPLVEDDGVADSAVGVLYDTGVGYPAAVFGERSAVIVGRVFTLRADQIDRALGLLDEVEGAVAGDYRRIPIVTLAGVSAWAYEYGGGLSLEAIPGGSWLLR